MFATVAVTLGVFLCGVERVKRFVYVHFRCIANKLKRIGLSNISTSPPLEKFLRTPVTLTSSSAVRDLKKKVHYGREKCVIDVLSRGDETINGSSNNSIQTQRSLFL